MNEEEKKLEQALKILEGALRAFWKENGKYFVANGRHTDVFVQPKFLLGREVNPEVAKQVIAAYLNKLAPEDIVRGKVIVTPDCIIIKDDDGQIIGEIESQKIINRMSNSITRRIGNELSRLESRAGHSYLEPKDEYNYGEIKAALAEFFMDMEKYDSKNALAEAVMLFFKEDGEITRLTQEVQEAGQTETVVNPLLKRRRLPLRPRF